MFQLRKEDLSVYLYLKDIVLKPFMEYQEGESLVHLAEMDYGDTRIYQIDAQTFPSPFDSGRGLVYFDEGFEDCLVTCATCSGTPEQSNRVVIYTADWDVIPDSEYMIDYIDGRIVTDSILEPAYIDYYWNYIAVVDEWLVTEAASAPSVVLDIHGTDKAGFQLGGGKKVDRKVNVHIFASSTAERKDITETIYDALYLKSCPNYVFPEGSVLDSDGLFYGRRDNMNKDETLFSRDTQQYVSNLKFENVSARNVALPLLMTRNTEETLLSDLNAFRAKITFDLVSYVEG